jgi:type IV secretory pathway TrbD component
VHRVAQLVAHVRARVDPVEEAFVQRTLAPPALALFAAMPVADRRHALDVAERLLAAGYDDRDLLSAALLHDAAKGHRMRLWHRVSGVLLEAIAPSILRRMARRDPHSWRHPFHLYLHHEGISADMVDAAGCPPRVGAFIRGTGEDADASLLQALKAADDAS